MDGRRMDGWRGSKGRKDGWMDDCGRSERGRGRRRRRVDKNNS